MGAGDKSPSCFRRDLPDSRAAAQRRGLPGGFESRRRRLRPDPDHLVRRRGGASVLCHRRRVVFRRARIFSSVVCGRAHEFEQSVSLVLLDSSCPTCFSLILHVLYSHYVAYCLTLCPSTRIQFAFSSLLEITRLRRGLRAEESARRGRSGMYVIRVQRHSGDQDCLVHLITPGLRSPSSTA